MTTIDETVSTENDLTELAQALTGALHLPGEPEFERLSTPWKVSVASRPRAVIAAKNAADVQTTVRFAAQHGMTVAVRSTGHGAFDELDDRLLIHTGLLNELHIDPAGRARVGAGLKWAAVIDAAAPYGLAPLAGSSPDVGVVGYLTGGGFGPLARSHGLSSDKVTAFDVVTGDGELRRASATENPALFWALRGGKGALGIVTAVEFDVDRLPTLFGGALYFAADDIPAVLRAWAAWCPTLPTKATTSIALLRLPELPGLPPQIAGKLTASMRFAFTGGDTAAGERAIAPMLDVAEPIFGGISEMPYAAIGMIHSDPVDPMPSHEQLTVLDRFDEAAVDALLEVAGPQSTSPQVVIEVRQLGGAINAAGAPASAFCHRSVAYTLFSVGLAAGPIGPITITDADHIAAAMQPFAVPVSLPNFSPGDDIENITRMYDAETLARLGTLMATFDPNRVIAASLPIRCACVAAAL